jgi:hypothetical protein
MLVLLFLPLFINAQEDEKGYFEGRDTFYLKNGDGVELMIINHTLKHFYYENTCVWEINYPELIKLNGSLTLSNNINSDLNKRVAIGTCDGDDCVAVEEELFPYFQNFWDVIYGNYLEKNVLFLEKQKGGCVAGEPVCYLTKEFLAYDLISGESFDGGDILSSESNKRDKFISMIKAKLNLENINENALFSEPTFKYDQEELEITYAPNTIKGNNVYMVRLSKNELRTVASSEGPFSYLLD